MAEIVDDTDEFTIALSSEAPETKIPWALLGAGLIALYLLFRKKG